MNTTQLFKASLACVVTLGVASVASTALAQSSDAMSKDTMHMQKDHSMATMKQAKFARCYGINAAYKNDCQSPGHSCAGQDSKARDPGAFVAVPAGLCTKIAGGSLKSA